MTQLMVINSEDLNYYSASWSGNPVTNWTVGLNSIRFSYPAGASTSSTTLLKFTSSVGGTAQVMVRLVQPQSNMSLSHEGDVLSVRITKEEAENFAESETAEVATLLIEDQANEPWTIEVINTATGARLDMATSPDGECRFDTSAWSAGIYLVKASNGIDTISKKITIK